MRSTDTDCAEIERLWDSTEEAVWQEALDRYWYYVKPTHLEIECEMDALQPDYVRQLDADEWYDWLLNKYFVWKYTARNRYVTTTGHLKHDAEVLGLKHLLAIRDRLLECCDADIQNALEVATHINGLGTAGASGLLALLFPTKFGTIDQFVVRALCQIRSLPERELLQKMNPHSLTVKNGVVLISIMRRKADSLNELFSTDTWTPRKIDMVLCVS